MTTPVITVPDGGPLTTVGNVKNYLKITSNGDDALLPRLVLAASAWIKTYTNRDFVQTTYTEVRDGTGGSTLQLANYPVVSIESIALGTPNVAPFVLSPTTDYVFAASGLVRVYSRCIPRGIANVRVTYLAGYVDIPDDIEQAAIAVVAWRYKESERIGQSSKSLGGSEVVSFQTKDVPDDIKTSLNNWRKVIPL